jgi:hypothetical protein
LLEKSKVVEQVDAELVKIVSASLVSQSTSFKTASMHCPLLPTTCTLWDQVEEDLLVVVVVVVVVDVDPAIEPLLVTYLGEVSPKLFICDALGALDVLGAFDTLGALDVLGALDTLGALDVLGAFDSLGALDVFRAFDTLALVF